MQSGPSLDATALPHLQFVEYQVNIVALAAAPLLLKFPEYQYIATPESGGCCRTSEYNVNSYGNESYNIASQGQGRGIKINGPFLPKQSVV